MNQVIVSAKISRLDTQQVRIEFIREGHGDDIVDQWADRVAAAAQFTVAQTIQEINDQRSAVSGQKSEVGGQRSESVLKEGLRQVARMLAEAGAKIETIAANLE